MIFRSFTAGFAACLLVSLGAMPAQAQVEKALAEAVSLCTAVLLQKPNEFVKAWVDAGFVLAPVQTLSPNWFSTGFTRDETVLTITELKFSKQQSTTCQYTAPVSVSLDQAKAFGTQLKTDKNLGPMEIEMGEIPMGSDQNMIMASMHRTENNPIINGSLQARQNFLFITFTRMTLKAN
jgi:hypothetical protein